MRSLLGLCAVALALVVLWGMAAGAAHAKSIWECRFLDDRGFIKGTVIGYDETFKCKCTIRGSVFRGGGVHESSFMVKAPFAGFGCKGYCIKSSKWNTHVDRIAAAMGEPVGPRYTERVKTMINTCRNRMWKWGADESLTWGTSWTPKGSAK